MWVLGSRVAGAGHGPATSQHRGNGDKNSSRSRSQIRTQHAFGPNTQDLQGRRNRYLAAPCLHLPDAGLCPCAPSINPGCCI
jgi:hypothetical protein